MYGVKIFLMLCYGDYVKIKCLEKLGKRIL